MEILMNILSRGIDQLFARTEGPLIFRLVVMPTVVSLIAIRAGVKDAREGRPAFLWEFVTEPSQRRRLLVSGWKDVGRIIIVALVLDTIYQFMVLRAFYIFQAVIVALVCAVLPYVVFRGPATRLAHLKYRNRTTTASTSAAGNGKQTDSNSETGMQKEDCEDE